MSTQPQNKNSANNKRIAKNTLVLYVRMLFLMAVNLYTSRVTLDALGASDYGIYNVVGGFVAMFSILSMTLSGACSRFLNFAMGEGNQDKLKCVFSTSVIIQYSIAIIIAILSSIIGLWYIQNKMVIPLDRITAAQWVLTFSIITFCSNLITVPYQASIIAHEKMKTFAMVGMLEGLGQLGIAFAIMASPIDKLVFYALLLCMLQFTIRAIYRLYSRKKFNECKFEWRWDSEIFKQMLGFSGWNFIGAASSIIRNQGNTILINLFFGPTVNASRAIANQVLKALNGFVTNFMTATKPQITQSYASGNITYMSSLVFKSAKFSFFLLFFLSLPVLFCADQLLQIWLKEVPDYAVILVRLTLIFTLVETVSQPLKTAQMATGNIKYYQIVVGGLQLLNIPLAYLILKVYPTPEIIMYVSIFIALICLFCRLILMKRLFNFDSLGFYHKVIGRTCIVTVLSLPIPFIASQILPQTFASCIIECFASCLSAGVVILFMGCDPTERDFIINKIKQIKHGKNKKSISADTAHS